MSAAFERRSALPGRRHRGAVLIVGLVILLVVTVLGVTGMRTTVMQERMAGNMRQHNIALQAAEAGLQAALSYIAAQTTPPAVDGSANIWKACTAAESSTAAACSRLDNTIDNWEGAVASLSDGVDYPTLTNLLGTQVSLPDVVAQPRVLIESRYTPPVDVEQAAQGAGVHYYTVTAVGFGGNDSSRAIVQSTVAKVYQY